MKVTQISYKYPPAYSGYGKQLYSINDHIWHISKDIQFTVLTGFDDSYEYDNVKVKNIVPFSKWTKKFKRIHFYIYVILVFIRLLFGARQPSVVHCIKAGPEAVVAVIAAKLTNRYVIVKVVQNEIRECLEVRLNIVRRFFRSLRLIILRKADFIIAISNEIYQELIVANFTRKKILKISNGIDMKRFSEKQSFELQDFLQNKSDISSEHIIGLFVGSVTSRKGIFDLLDSLKYSSNLSKLSIFIVGPDYSNGILSDKIRKIEEKTNQKLVVYFGEQPEIEKFYNASHFLILPSYSEGQPNVILEALSSGLPVIGSKIGGIEDIITDGYNGYMITPGNCQEIAHAIDLVIENFDVLQNNARMSIENFSIQNIAEQYFNLYSKCFK